MKNYKPNQSSINHAVSLLSATCLSLSLLSTPVFADKAVANSFKTNTATVKTIKARNNSDVNKAFRIARADSHSAIVITCHPPDHKWCAGDFQTACEEGGGGLSTEPDGGISCSAETD